MKLKKNQILILIFVPLGFFCSLFLFRFLTTQDSMEISQIVPPVVTKEPPSTVILKKKSQVAVPPSDVSKTVPKSKKAAVEKRRRVAFTSEVKKTVFPPLKINGIISNKDGNLALINDIIIEEGDEILGATIFRIDTNYVEVQMNGEKKILRIK